MSSARALCTITKDDKALTAEYLSKLAKKGSEMCTKIVESSKQLKACATLRLVIRMPANIWCSWQYDFAETCEC